MYEHRRFERLKIMHWPYIESIGYEETIGS